MADAPYVYDATVERIVDGDTIVLRLEKTFLLPVDFGFRVKDVVGLTKSAVIVFRLLGINTPETKGDTRVEGEAAKAELTRLLGLGSIRVESFKSEKFGRWLAKVYVQPESAAEICVNDALIESGHAKPYTGEGPRT